MTCIKPCLTALAIVTTITSQSLYAGQNWETKLDLQSSYGNYSGSELRDNTSNTGAFLTGDYLERWGYTVGYNRTAVNYKQSISKLTQDDFFGSVRVHFRPDSLSGRLTFRLDGHSISNNDPTGNTDDGSIVAPMMSYLSKDKNLYLDLGYAYSSYKGDLSLDQWTPTLGFGFNERYDWIQLRGYLISSSNEVRTQGKDSTAAVEAKWFHYFKPGAFLSIDQLQLAGLAGDRIFAVDPDSAAVYNLADIQKGSLSLGLGWDFPHKWSMLLIGGNESYENRDINDEYSNIFGYVNVSKKW